MPGDKRGSRRLSEVLIFLGARCAVQGLVMPGAPRRTSLAGVKRLLAGLAFVAIVAAALVLTATGGSGDEREATVPALAVTRMDGKGEFDLAQLASSETPTLLWFW